MKIMIHIEADGADDLRQAIRSLAPLAVRPEADKGIGMIVDKIAEKLSADAKTADDDQPVARRPRQEEPEDDDRPVAAPKRERGKPDPASGRKRRTKEEIEEDDAAEAEDARRAAGAKPVKDLMDAVEAEERASSTAPAVDDNDTYWHDTKKDEVFVVPAGEDLPPNDDRYEELTERRYDKMLAERKAAKPVPKGGKEITYEDVTAKIHEYVALFPSTDHGEAATETGRVWRPFGVTKIKDLKPADAAEVVDQLQEMIDAKMAEKKTRKSR